MATNRKQIAANVERAQRGQDAVNDYKLRHDPHEPTETVITDLITDLQHLVRTLANPRNDPNGYLLWLKLTESAHRHFIMEVQGL